MTFCLFLSLLLDSANGQVRSGYVYNWTAWMDDYGFGKCTDVKLCNVFPDGKPFPQSNDYRRKGYVYVWHTMGERMSTRVKVHYHTHTSLQVHYHTHTHTPLYRFTITHTPLYRFTITHTHLHTSLSYSYIMHQCKYNSSESFYILL